MKKTKVLPLVDEDGVVVDATMPAYPWLGRNITAPWQWKMPQQGVSPLSWTEEKQVSDSARNKGLPSLKLTVRPLKMGMLE